MDASISTVKHETLAAMRKDLKTASTKLGRKEVQYLVKMYYDFQKYRIVSNNRIKAVEKRDDGPVACLGFFKGHFEDLEKTMIVPLKNYVENDPVGQWLISQRGIGPVIAAGFLSFLDVTRASSASHFISYAGLDPSMSWDLKAKQWKRTHTKHDPATGKRIFIGETLMGRKRPFNLELKTLCFKFSKSIVMVGGDGEYRKIYDARKAQEVQYNAAGMFREQALMLLERLNRGDTDSLLTEDYDDMSDEDREKEVSKYRKTLAQGQLVPAHLDARARRYLNTIFLNHIFQVMYELHYKAPAPIPYALAHLGHVDMIYPPKYTPLKRN